VPAHYLMQYVTHQPFTRALVTRHSFNAEGATKREGQDRRSLGCRLRRTLWRSVPAVLAHDARDQNVGHKRRGVVVGDIGIPATAATAAAAAARRRRHLVHLCNARERVLLSRVSPPAEPSPPPPRRPHSLSGMFAGDTRAGRVAMRRDGGV